MTHQYMIASRLGLSNKVRHQSLTARLKVLVSLALKINDYSNDDDEILCSTSRQKCSTSKQKQVGWKLESLKEKFVKETKSAENFLLFSNFDWGPDKIYLKSWMDCGGNSELASRLESYMAQRLLWNGRATHSLDAMLQKVNKLFFQAYFYISQGGILTLMENVTIKYPFVLPYTGNIVRDNSLESKDLALMVQQNIFIKPNLEGGDYTGHFATSKNPQNMFEVCRSRIGCISVKQGFSMASRVLKCDFYDSPETNALNSSDNDDVVVMLRQYKFLDPNIDNTHCIKQLEQKGFVVVHFTDNFRSSIATILGGDTLNAVLDQVGQDCVGVSDSRSEQDQREYFTLKSLGDSVLATIIRGLMCQCCLEVMNSIDDASRSHPHTLVFEEGNSPGVCVISTPGAATQRPHADCVQNASCRKRVSASSLSIFGKKLF